MTSDLAIVTGASGFYGRWLTLDLLRAGRPVTALLRNASSRVAELRAWIEARGVDASRLEGAAFDLTAVDLGLDDGGRAAIASARDVYHLGAVFAFGLDRELARAANVTGTERLLALAAEAPELRRFVHASGYLVADDRHFVAHGIDPDAPYQARDFEPLYRRLGGYEASKMEADRLVADAGRRGLPITVVGPGGILGDSVSGETSQWDLGFTALVESLASGTLHALPRLPRAWTPLVTVDFAAAFTARIVLDPGSVGQRYALLDERTPDTIELAQKVAGRLGVKAPRWRVGRLTMRIAFALGLAPGSAEQLTFLDTKRYDTRPMLAAAAGLDLELPDIDGAIDRCVDYAVAKNFGRKADTVALA